MYQSLQAGRRVTLDHVGIFADGVAVREVGELTFALAQQAVDEVVRVTNDEICAAIKDIFDDTRSVMEPAGALAVAGLKAWAARQRRRADGQRLAAVLSGANMNFDRLRFVAERAELGEAREALFAVTIPERPGAFREFCATLGRRVVTEFNYRLGQPQTRRTSSSASARPRGATRARWPTPERRRLRDARPLRQRDGQAARPPHGRRRAPATRGTSGRAASSSRSGPGALMQFLDALGGRWNISLFHYRNHGADFGRVLAAFEVPDEDVGAVPRLPGRPRLSLPARNRQPRVRLVPRMSRPARDTTLIARARRRLTRWPDARSTRPRRRGSACGHRTPAALPLSCSRAAEALHRAPGRLDAHVRSRRRCAGLHGAGAVGRVPAGGDVPGKHACGVDARGAGVRHVGAAPARPAAARAVLAAGADRGTGRMTSSRAPDRTRALGAGRSAVGGGRWARRRD